ncbi:MAG: SIMPL domain-containing protein [Bacteroidota bacterium]
MWRFLLFLALTVAAPVFIATEAFAQQAARITVSGEASQTVQADRALVYLAFETEGTTANEALDRHQSILGDVNALLDSLGIGDDQVRVENLAVRQQQGGRRGMSAGNGDEETFVVSRALVVTLDDLDLVQPVTVGLARDAADLETALAVRGRNVEVRYTVRDPEGIQDAVLAEAMMRAQARAELVAAAAGVELGPVVSVRERGAYNGEGNGMGFEEMAEVSMLAQSQMLLANESRITVSVVVSYAMGDG